MIPSSIISPDDVILVTGANGFVGSRVVRTLLAYGFRRVRCLSRPTSPSRNIESIQKEFGSDRIEMFSVGYPFAILFSRDEAKANDQS